MPISSLLSRRLSCASALAAVGVVLGAAWMPQTALAQSAPTPQVSDGNAAEFLRKPPRVDYAKICPQKRDNPVSRDWTAWDGTQKLGASDQMLADAGRYVDGGFGTLRNKPLARRMLEQLAGGRDLVAPAAKRRLAMLLLDPEAGPTDAPRAEQLLQEALRAQEIDAALTLGRLYRTGALTSTDPEAATRYLGTAAGLGDPRAALELAAIYSMPGAAVPFQGAAEHYRTLAFINAQSSIVKGDCEILTDVGDFFQESEGDAGAAAAAEWYATGVKAGSARSELKLGRLYAKGLGKPKDDDAARSLFDAAIKHGSVDALVPAARLALVAPGQTPRALDLLGDAVANRDMDGAALLARYYRGDFTGKADLPKMFETLRTAGEWPGASPVVLASLAEAYAAGQGTDVDQARADAVLEKLAALTSPDADLATSQFLLDEGRDLSTVSMRLQRAASAGNADAAAALSQVMACAPGAGTPDRADALRQQAAEGGSTLAMRRLADLALDRNDTAAAEDWLTKASALGDRNAMVELAKLLQRAGGAEAERVKPLVEAAAAPGDNMWAGRLALARAYLRKDLPETGEGADALLASISASAQPDVDLDIARRDLAAAAADPARRADALPRLQRAAAGGSADAMLMLSRLAKDGVETGATMQEWMARAAERGQPDALAALAPDAGVAGRVLASLNNRVVCNTAALVRWASLQRAFPATAGASSDALLEQARLVARDDAKDLVVLGQSYADGTATGTPEPAKAEPFLAKAANSGSPKAAVAFAHLLTNAPLGERYPEAISWLRKAALAGEPSAIRELVTLSSERAGTPAELDQALGVLKEAADAQLTDAMFAYGSVLATARPERRDEGVAFIQKAAEAGDVEAMKSLARLHASGLTGTVSANESTRWTRVAAEHGDAESMFQYALALDLGFGVKADHQAALAWHEKAKENGFAQ